MIWVVLPLALVFVAGLFLLGRLYGEPTGRAGLKVVIIVKDQEPWVEGVIRKAFRCLPRVSLRLQVLDDCSRDATISLLQRLARDYPFEMISEKIDPIDEPALLRLDFRGLKGRELIRSPLFSLLSHLNAGKSQVLSK